MINILISDPNLLVREGIKEILSTMKDIGNINEASDIQDIPKNANEFKIDVAILEITAASERTIGAIRETRKTAPSTNIVVYTLCPERHFAVRALHAGARSFLHKACTNCELVNAIRRAAAGNVYLNENLRELLARSLDSDETESSHDKLSERDFDILCLIASGVPSLKIAKLVHVSTATVQLRKNSLMRQLSLDTVSDLVKYAVNNRLIDNG
jgi:two-component system invasion response regulator UvrY